MEGSPALRCLRVYALHFLAFCFACFCFCLCLGARFGCSVLLDLHASVHLH